MGNKLISWILFTALTFIWGSSFLLMKLGMETLTPYQVASLRILSAGIVLMPFAARSFKLIPKEKRGAVILSGLLGSFFPAYLFCLAETKIDSAFTGMLNSLTPLFTVVIGVAFYKFKVTLKKVAGVLIGLVGFIVLILVDGKPDLTHFAYITLVIAATVCYAINVNMVSKYLKEIGSLNIATIAFVFLIIPCIAILAVTGYFKLAFNDMHIIKSTIASCILGIMGTATASILFYRLVKRAGALFAAMVTYGIPVVAVLWGIVYGEHITWMHIGGLAIILSGVYVANK